MKILGISDSHDAAVVVVRNDEIVFAAQEERFTRRKRQRGFPLKALESYIESEKDNRKFDLVCVGGQYGRAVFRLFNKVYYKSNPQKDVTTRLAYFVRWLENTIALAPFIRHIDHFLSYCALSFLLRKAGVRYRRLMFVDHHLAHIYSSLACLNRAQTLAVSMDAYGDGLSGRAIYFQNGKVRNRAYISYNNSIAHLYGTISAYLGFDEGDEGKTMALAEKGGYSDAFRLIRSLVRWRFGTLHINSYYQTLEFREKLLRFSKEDIAYALQRNVEAAVIVQLRYFAKRLCRDIRGVCLALSGGLFANVKLNQKIYMRGIFKEVWISPAMNDSGLAFAALRPYMRAHNKGNLTPRFKNIFLGPRYTKDEIHASISKYPIISFEIVEPEKQIVELLIQGYSVARWCGRMEFGPRALGNRSIFYPATKRNVETILNTILHRDNFMPFAPATLDEDITHYYKSTQGIQHATRFMTITTCVTDQMKKVAPGAVYCDNTARPQIVGVNDNASLHTILSLYKEATGSSNLINTSFNKHGDPIVCSPDDALLTFMELDIDFLVIEQFLVFKEKMQHAYRQSQNTFSFTGNP